MKAIPAKKSKNTVAPETILEDHTAKIRAIAEQLRKLIRMSMPEADENGQSMWHSINYRHPKAGYVCGIFPRKEYVDLVFEFGILLPDPHKILQGDGKQVQYIRITENDKLHEKAIKQLIRDALSLPESRAVKLDLIRARVHITR